MATPRNEDKGSHLEQFFNFGYYQLFLIIMTEWLGVSSGGNVAFMVFGGLTPDIYCPNGTQIDMAMKFDSDYNNVTLLNTARPTPAKEACNMIKNGLCPNHTTTNVFYSAVIEWDLYCDSSAKHLATSLQMLGILVGAPIAGQLSDAFGRKKAMLVSGFMMLVVGGTSSFSPNWTVFTAFRFVIGVCLGALWTSSYVMQSEVLIHKHRLWAMALVPPMYPLFALGAYLVNDWRNLAILINCFGIIPFLLLWFSKESARWLVQQHRLKEAEEVMLSISKWNRRKIDEAELRRVIYHEASFVAKRKKGRKHTFWHLCYTWKLARYQIVLMIAWFSVSFISYGVMFNTEKLSGSPFLNMALFGFARWVSSLLVFFCDVLLRCCGRKGLHTFAGSMIALLCAAVAVFMVVPELNALAITPKLINGLTMTSVVFFSFLWIIVYLLSSELFPTPIRNLANSSSSMAARVGGILAPQVLRIGDDIWRPAPYVAFALMALFDTIFFLIFLPETKGKPLPEHMPDKEHRISIWGCGCYGNNSDLKGQRGRSLNKSDSFQFYDFTAPPELDI